MAVQQSFALQPLSGVLGAQVTGIDLGQPLDPQTLAELRAAFVQHGVLVFPDQDLSEDQQMAFGRQFGELDMHPFVVPNPDNPEMLHVVTEPDDYTNFGGGWHTDVTFLEEPDLGSVLYALETPPVGGDTLFANQQAAYDALSDTMKGMLDGLTAVHSAARQYGAQGQSRHSKAMPTQNEDLSVQQVVHPVVRTHPESGRKGLYVNGAFTERIKGMRTDESQALLGFLLKHAVKERFTCRVTWEPGQLAMWDNRTVQHYALHDYIGHRRHMRRITIKGDRPV